MWVKAFEHATHCVLEQSAVIHLFDIARANLMKHIGKNL